MMEAVSKASAELSPEVKAERLEKYYANITRDHGENAGAMQRCMFSDESKNGNVQEFWIDNVWQKVGVRYLSVQDYIDHVYYAPKGGNPWLLIFALTPYNDPRPDHKMSLIMLKRVVCAKKVYGDSLNVGLVDSINAEFVREAFDLDSRRMGTTATHIALVHDGIVHYTASFQHGAEAIAELIDSRGAKTAINHESVPYPVNEITIFWQYFLKDIQREKIFFIRFTKWLKKVHPDSPILTKIINPYFMEPKFYMPKQSSRRIFFIIYCPIIFTVFMIIRSIWIGIKKIFCKRRSVTRAPSAAKKQTATGNKREKVE